MPVYEFRCADCDQFFDRLLPYGAPEPPCPACGGEDVRRLISLIGGLAEASGTGSESSVGCGGCGGTCACAQ